MERERLHSRSQSFEIGLFGASFFFQDDSGLPMRFSTVLSNLALARRCCGVWAYTDCEKDFDSGRLEEIGQTKMGVWR